ncbi:unnamed protein product [Ectocarpus sp. 12 AP-2014]
MDKLSQLTLDKLSLDKVKNMVGEVRDTIAPRNDTEKRVYEALSNKNWGASSTLLNDIARDTYDFEKYGIVLPLIWTSLQSPSREWRKVFKWVPLRKREVSSRALPMRAVGSLLTVPCLLGPIFLKLDNSMTKRTPKSRNAFSKKL